MFGRSRLDAGIAIRQTLDGGYIVAVDSRSVENDGGSDLCVIKLNAAGDITWQRSLDGSGRDRANDIQQTADGGYIVVGRSYSNDGDVSENSGGTSSWVVKLDADGEIEWQRSLGGSGTFDVFRSVRQTMDGGYVIAGCSNSNDGDVSANRGGVDFWIVKLDATGNLVWEKFLGGSGNETATSIQQTSDGGYIVAVRSNSNDGDVPGNRGESDIWIVKLNYESPVRQ